MELRRTAQLSDTWEINLTEPGDELKMEIEKVFMNGLSILVLSNQMAICTVQQDTGHLA